MLTEPTLAAPHSQTNQAGKPTGPGPFPGSFHERRGVAGDGVGSVQPAPRFPITTVGR
jgi:hypothetical protein